MRSLPRAAAHCVVTSPPYYGLRDYAGHPAQLGQEPTPGAYIDALRQVLAEVVRICAPTARSGSTSVTSTADATGTSVDRRAGHGHRAGITAKQRINTTGTAPYKSLLLMPSRVAIALSGDGWLVRNDIVWHKPNAMPESVTDRFSTRYEHLFLLTRRPSYYFDLDAIKVTAGHRRGGNRDKAAYAAAVGTEKAARRFGGNPASTLASKEFAPRNPGDVWSIATRRTGRALRHVPPGNPGPMHRRRHTPRRTGAGPVLRGLHHRPGGPSAGPTLHRDRPQPRLPRHSHPTPRPTMNERGSDGA